MQPFTVLLDFIGCRLNEAELQMWAVAFARKGGRLVSRGAGASATVDVVVLNSCTVTAEAARKSRQRIRRLRRDYPQAFLVMTGCYSAVAPPDELARLEVDLQVANITKETLVEQVIQALEGRQEHLEQRDAQSVFAGSFLGTQHGAVARSPNFLLQPAEDLRSAACVPTDSPYRARGMQRAFLKIQDGCRYRCAYCIVTIARGPERSRPIEAILEDLAAIETEGLNEVVLSGVQIGGYGSEFGLTLADLLETLLARTTVPRIRLSSLEPWNLSDHFLDLLAHPRVQPHLHLPMQSGADSVLRRMFRRGSAAEFSDILERYYQRVPEGVVTTDIIAGFPGESVSEWRQTMALIGASNLGGVHCFPFSARAGTVAATLPGRLSSEEIHARCEEMNALSRDLIVRTARRFSGSCCDVLWENLLHDAADGLSYWHGLTPQFMKVAMVVNDRQERAGLLERVELRQFDAEAERFVADPCG